MKRLVSVLIVCLIAVATLSVLQSVKAEPTQKSDAKAKPPAVTKDAKVDTPKKKKPPKVKEPILRRFMRQKLEASNMVLEGLVTDDLGMVEVASNQLLKMSQAEMWRTTADKSYARYSNQFVRAVERLKEKSKKGSVDGAALAWMNVTHSCIECHEWVRNVIIADSRVLP